jgi:hypothetical protein
VDSSDCHRKAVKAAGTADRLAVVGSGAAGVVVVAGAAGVDDVFAVDGRWEGKSRERTGCEWAIAGAGSKE